MLRSLAIAVGRFVFDHHGQMPAALHDLVAKLIPLDDIEAEHRGATLAWIASGRPIYRTAKPATPPEHLVAYCVLVDPQRRSVLLVDHRDAGEWLATGGHVDVDEDPAEAAKRELHEELVVSSPFLPGLEDIPLLVTRAVTAGISAGHTDVGLWYAFEGSENEELQPDPREFTDIRWWPIEQVRRGGVTRLDPNLPRFMEKLVQHWERNPL